MPVTGKIWDRFYGQEKPVDEEYQSLVSLASSLANSLFETFCCQSKNLLKSPTDKFEIPRTSSQEYGWCHGDATAFNRYGSQNQLVLKFTQSKNPRNDSRVNFFTKHGELSRYMYQYWKINTDAPASEMNVKRKVINCHKLGKLRETPRTPRNTK